MEHLSFLLSNEQEQY